MSGVLDNVKVGDKLFVTSRWRKAIEVVENIRKEIARKMMLAGCRKINFDNLTDTQLEQILKIVNPDLLNGK